MPLYMDFHQLEGITVEDVKKAHMADIAVQHKYGVRYLQFWVNEKAGTTFCLIEGPDPESCEACHQEAHGNIACNIQEVEQGLFKLLMGDGLPSDHHLTLTMEGEVDSANRTVLVADIKDARKVDNLKQQKLLHSSAKPKSLAVGAIAKFNGRFIEYTNDDMLLAVFDSPFNAVRCARNIQNTFLDLNKISSKSNDWGINFKIALNTGQPITEEKGFFEIAIRPVKRMCMIAESNQITFGTNLQYLSDEATETLDTSTSHLCKLLTESEEDFLNEIFDHIEQNISVESFNVNGLSKLIGLSQSQLYRKTIKLTGKSPNDLISNIRMSKALNLLNSKKGIISEVALEVGFSNPSYFTKKFSKSFGCNPSSLSVSSEM